MIPILLSIWLLAQNPQEKPINIVCKQPKQEKAILRPQWNEDDKVITIFKE